MAKKKFAFIAPTVLAAAAIGGVVSGAAGTVGRKAVEDVWNNKSKEPKEEAKHTNHVYTIDVGKLSKHELILALREIQEAWEDAHPPREEEPHSPFYPTD